MTMKTKITKTKIAGIEFGSFVCNASGPNDSTLEELEAIVNSASSAIIFKSCTIEPRKGNDEPRYVRLPYGSIQSMGLPNLGYKEYIKFASQLRKHDKPIVASIAGLCIDDYVKMVRAFQDSDVDLIEVNLSCPNLEGKSQVGYDFRQTEEILRRIIGLGDKLVGLKLPPYYEPVHNQKMAKLVEKYKVSFITCINSVGNTLVIDPELEAPVIDRKSTRLNSSH